MATFTAIPEKTQSAVAMKRVIDYVMQDKKTMFYDTQNGQRYKLTGGQNCVPEAAYEEFMATKHQYNKAKVVFFKQYVQSFKPGCGATPQQIHAAGMEMAKTFDGYEVLVATHIDADHWHNHLVVNSVSCETGRKIQINEKGLEDLRKRSDEICRQFGLEVLEPYQKPKQHSINQREYRAALRGNSKKLKLMNAIDQSVIKSRSKTQFIARMKKLGYDVKWIDSYKYITYTSPDGQKFRDNRLFGDKYLKVNLEDLFAYGHENVTGYQSLAGAERGNSGSPDRAGTADVCGTETRAVQRACEAYPEGWRANCERHGFDITSSEPEGYERADDGNNGAASPFVAESGGGRKKRYRQDDGFQNDRIAEFRDEYNPHGDSGHEKYDENAGPEAMEAPTQVGRDRGDIAIGAAYLAADIQMMLSEDEKNERQKKEKPMQHTGKKQKKKQGQSHDDGFDMSM